jgi:hypothetical protein
MQSIPNQRLSRDQGLCTMPITGIALRGAQREGRDE